MNTPIGEFNPGIQDAGRPDKFVAEFGDPSFDLALGVREPFERLVVKCALFLEGQQWLSVAGDGRGHHYTRDTRPEQCEETRIVNNQLSIFVRSIISAISGSMPELQGMPAGSESPDIEASHIATRVLKWREREDHEDQKREEELGWLLVAGEVLRRTFWDAKGGNDQLRGGDVATEIVPFFSYLKDPFSWQKWPPNWIIEYDARHVDWVTQQYGVKVEPEAVSDKMRHLNRLAMGVPGGSAGQLPNLDNHAILKRMTSPPSERNPKGHTWVWANAKLLKEHDLQSGKFPYEKGTWFPLPGRMYPAGLVELVLADQRRLNVLLSQIQESINREMRHDIATSGPDQKINMEVYDERSGAKHFKLPMGVEKWEFLKYNPDWQEGKVAYDMVMNDMKEKVAQNKPSLGQPMGKTVTLGELQLAREGDAEGLTWHLQQFIRYISAVAAQKLVLTHDFVKNWRTIPGTARDPDLPFFLGAELRNTTDVVAVPTPRLTPALKQQAIREAFQVWDSTPPQLRDDPAFLWGFRMQLKYTGLEELEDDFSRVFGPIEQLEDQLRLVGGKRAEATALQAEGMANQAALGIATQEMQAQQMGAGGGGQDQNAPSGLPGAAVGQPQGQPVPAMAGVG